MTHRGILRPSHPCSRHHILRSAVACRDSPWTPPSTCCAAAAWPSTKGSKGFSSVIRQHSRTHALTHPTTLWRGRSKAKKKRGRSDLFPEHLLRRSELRRDKHRLHRLKEHLIEQRIVGEYQISVLQGGADQWVRRFHADAALVHGFDNEYWGFYPFEGEDGETGAAGAEAEAAAAAPMHVLYERPRDQPATPWSERGSEAVPHGATMIAGDSGDNGGHGAGARPCSPPLTSSAASAESATQLQADVLAWRAEPATGASSQVAVVGADAGAEAGT